MTRHLVRLGCAALMFAAAAMGADDTPRWLQEAAAVATPRAAESAGMVVLADEENVTVDEGGRIVTTRHHAVRILAGEAKDAAVARQVYISGTGKVKEFRAWLVPASGATKRYSKDKVLDVALAENDVYNEVRAKLIPAARDADAGSVFGYESVVEDHAMFLQAEWLFQGRAPVVSSRYSVTLPAGWRVESAFFNSEPVAPQVAGNTWMWEMRDLKQIHSGEPASPGVMALAPRIVVTFVPPDGAKGVPAKAFTKWQEVSRWLAEQAEPQAATGGAVEEKARALTAASKTEMEKVEAVGRFVQGINYVSIQTGVGRGGGYRPHAAPAVLAKSYGDCKDKANLMRTLLKAIGIEAYLVAIYAGDRTYVHETWPSPQQFNHMIVAIRLREKKEAAAVLEHDALGTLLLFDPTDPYTPFGYLPEHEQDSFALLVSASGGDLLRMPATPPSASRMQRQTVVTLGEMGDITATVHEVSTGEAASRALRTFRRNSASSFRKIMEQWVTAGAKGAEVTKLEPVEKAGEFQLDLEFAARQYGQSMQRRMLIFKPAVVSRRESARFTATARRYPILLNSEGYNETVRVKLPAGFKVDEKPKNAKVDTPFGKYRASYEEKDGELWFTRSMEVRAMTVPAADYSKVRGFYQRIQAAESEPVVLVRQ